MTRILIASPVRQKPAILREFLAGLEGLDTDRVSIGYSFVDDNTDDESRNMLRGWHGKVPKNVISQPGSKNYDYTCDEDNHHWTDSLVQRVARFKDDFIQEAISCGYDYLFLVDSDIVLHPKTLTHLVSLGKDIVSEVFWTRWPNAAMECPQVWRGGDYRLHELKYPGEPVTQEEGQRRTGEFLNMLRKPGVYPVGGLGACTLISRKALEAGVSFSRLSNVDFVGEDRHFCIRAVALGLELWADTYFTPYHIYRESELPGLALWRDRQRERGSRITVGMLVRNEAGRYLRDVLEQTILYADRVVILDDASTDTTVQLCHGILSAACYEKDFPHIISHNPRRGFDNEIGLRKQLWELATENNPDWIIILDADELLEPRAIEKIRRMAADPEAEAYTFRLFDMWSPTHYRGDALWSAHRRPWPLMVRYIPGREYVWNEQPLHCGRMPANVLDGLTVKDSGLRIKHMGWATEKDRQEKAERYAQLDPEGIWGIKAQYDSILDPSPTLRPWVDEGNRPTISLCMIVKDEERNLPRCLESVGLKYEPDDEEPCVDEVVVVDTGSTDRTRNICGHHGTNAPRIHPWNNDFSEVRNLSLKMAKGDWILFLDADEELPPASRDGLRRLIQNAPPEVEGYFVRITSAVGEGKETCPDLVFRLFRNRPEYRFEGAIHEQITESIRRHQGRDCFGIADLEIIHHGFTLAEIERKGKAGRNLAMIEADPPADGEQLKLYQYGIELMNAGRWDDALTQFCRAMQGMDPRQIFLPKMVRGVVLSLMEAGRPDRALAVVRLGMRLWPDYADLWYWGGIILKDRDLRRAGEYFSRALETDEQPPQYSSTEGVRGYRSMYEIGRIEEALHSSLAADWYHKALADRSDFAEAAIALKRLEERNEGNPAELTDWELLCLLMTTVQADGDMDIIAETSKGRRAFKVSAEGIGRVVEGRCE